MKKRIAALLICSVAAMTVLGGCGGNDSDSDIGSSVSAEAENDVITADVLLQATDYDIADYVTLMDDYMNLSVEITSNYEVTDDDVQDYIESYVLPYYPQVIESDKTAVEDGDVVNIDYVGTIDGEEFDGGSAENYDLTIGSGEFIDGFEDGLIGAEVGSTVELNLTFPEDYGNDDLNGKDVVFTVTINSIIEEKTLEYEEMTDDYIAATFSDYGFVTVDDLLDDIRATLESSNESARTSEIQESVLAQLEEGCTVSFPDGLLDERVNTVLEQIQDSAESYDMEYMDFVSTYYGYDNEDDFNQYVSDTLESQLAQELILEAIVADRQVSISLSDFDDFVNTYLDYYGYDSAEEFYEVYGGETYVQLSFAENTALNEIIDAAETTVVEDAE